MLTPASSSVKHKMEGVENVMEVVARVIQPGPSQVESGIKCRLLLAWLEACWNEVIEWRLSVV